MQFLVLGPLEVTAGGRAVRLPAAKHRALLAALLVRADQTVSADGLIEAIRRPGETFMAAVQWHPEFHRPGEGTLDDAPLLADFLAAARAARTAR